MLENAEKPARIVESPPMLLLESIESEQVKSAIAVDAAWRLATVLLLCSAIVAPSIPWRVAGVALLAIGVGTFVVERDVSSRRVRIRTVRKSIVLARAEEPVAEVQKYIEFMNSHEMIPFVHPYQHLARWVWAGVTGLAILSRTVV